MASAPANLPLFYNDLVPLNSRDHATWRARTIDKAPWLANQHAVPLTVEEFPQAGRLYPIVFSSGQDVVPLALMGLNEGVNVFVEADGTVTNSVYLPAYARRYPFMLAKLQPTAQDLSLCFDPASGLLGEFDDGQVLFDGTATSQATQAILQFCESFEQAGQRTQAFVEELKKHDLLMEGEVSIQPQEGGQPYVYRGFQMVDQEKLRNSRGDVLRGWAQNVLLPLIYAHILSLELISTVFAMQNQQGKGPIPTLPPLPTF